MAIFSATGTASQSADGTVLNLLDTSDYIGNTETYTRADFVRTWVLTNAVGALIATVAIDPDDTAEYALTSDIWINATLTLTGVGIIPDYTKIVIPKIDRFTATKYQTVMRGGCCRSGAKQVALNNANSFLREADYAFPVASASRYNQAIIDANKFLDQILNVL